MDIDRVAENLGGVYDEGHIVLPDDLFVISVAETDGRVEFTVSFLGDLQYFPPYTQEIVSLTFSAEREEHTTAKLIQARVLPRARDLFNRTMLHFRRYMAQRSVLLKQIERLQRASFSRLLEQDPYRIPYHDERDLNITLQTAGYPQMTVSLQGTEKCSVTIQDLCPEDAETIVRSVLLALFGQEDSGEHDEKSEKVLRGGASG